MKKILKILICLMAVLIPIGTVSGVAFAGSSTFRDADLKVGQILHNGNFITITGKTVIRYFSSVQEEKANQTYEYENGREPAVKNIGDTSDWVVLFNETESDVRNIELYPHVNNGVGGVDAAGLAIDETVLGGSWLDFANCRGKTRTVRYFKDGEAEPFYTQTTGNRYMRLFKRAQTASFAALDYTVSYWHVKNVDSSSGTIELVAGRDIGLARMIKANEMYRTQVVPAGTFIDYSAARYISFHFYASEYAYDKGNEFYCFNYHDRKEGEERFMIAGLGYSYAAYTVMSANTSHVHLVAMNGPYPVPNESVIYAGSLIPGDALYNGSVLTYDSYGAKTINFYTADHVLITGQDITDPKGITIANPDGINAGSWVVSAVTDNGLNLTALNFAPEALLIPSDANQNAAYSGACMKINDKNYYYYDQLSVAIVDAKVNATLTRKDFIGDKNVLKALPDCDKVLLVKNVDKIDARYGAKKGVSKGIVIDFNGHSASSVCVGTIPVKETLIFTNSRENKSYITGNDAFYDLNEKDARTGTVVFHNLHIASKIYPAQHTLYFLNGEYVLNPATVMDNDKDNYLVLDAEKCPLYKFYENYPYWTCSVTPADPSLDYPNGEKIEKNGKIYYFYTDMAQANSEAKDGDVVKEGNTVPSGKPIIGGDIINPEVPADEPTTKLTIKQIVLPIVILAVAVGGVTVAVIFIVRKKKKKRA